MSARLLLLRMVETFEQRPTAHTTGTLARDVNSNPIAATSPFAVCWCTHGFLMKAANSPSLDAPSVAAASDLLQRAAVELGYPSVTRCNDALGRQGALGMGRRAIELHDMGLPTQATPISVLEGSTT